MDSIWKAFQLTRRQYGTQPFLHIPAHCSGGPADLTYAERLTYYKLPGYIAFVDRLPVTATQKLRYGAVAELASALVRNHAPSLFDIRNAKRNIRTAH
jgi:acyl-CoA synthetase (AMP-forming)/AMP-acid ligase II